MKKIAILGSGASAIAAATKLIDNSSEFKITIIDFAGTNEPSEGDFSVGSSIKSSASKHLFQIPSQFKMSTKSNSVMGSAAFGGWAEAWGATIVPFDDKDFLFNGLSAGEFHKEESFIRKLLKGGVVETQNEELRIIPDIFARRFGVKNRFISEFSPSDLAIKGLHLNIDFGCNQCGKCLFGCPNNHIFKPSSNWQRIEMMKNVETLKNVWIESISEMPSGILVNVRDRSDSISTETYDYVFCGLGPIQTAALLIRSGISEKVLIKDSQLVVTPFIDILLRKTGTTKNRVALSEAFLQASVPFGQGSVFAQLYGSSPALTSMIVEQIKWLKIVPSIIRNLALKRIGIAMQFLDSSQSGQIEITMKEGLTQVLGSKSMRSNFFLKIFPNLPLLGIRLIPIFFLSKVYNVGAGYHFGGSFPFSVGVDGNSSDSLGRPNGLTRFSIVDSSTICSLVAKPTTYNAMVKACVIVSRVLQSENAA